MNLSNKLEEKRVLDEKKKKRSKKPYSSIYIGNGNPAADIKFFNYHAGSDKYLNGTINASTASTSDTALAVSPDGGNSVSLSGTTGNAGGCCESLGIKEEGDETLNYNIAVAYAKKLKKPVFYGYKKNGRFFMIPEPFICDRETVDCSKEFEYLYHLKHNETKILAAYPNSSFLESVNLDEAKRYVRRYYIRPQEIFCSNKAEVLKALVDHNDEDCIIFTLNNLGDIKDTRKLTDDDIIYYYKDGILYDKNEVKVMDYDLAIKHEEDRERINPDQVSDARYKDVYQDRITELTMLDESNEFNLDFADAEDNETGKHCCICGEDLIGLGNNAEPYKKGRCCDACYMHFIKNK